jgi:hypothetical protein
VEWVIVFSALPYPLMRAGGGSGEFVVCWCLLVFVGVCWCLLVFVVSQPHWTSAANHRIPYHALHVLIPSYMLCCMLQQHRLGSIHTAVLHPYLEWRFRLSL